MIIVGLTGGIGSGKTTIAKMFQKLGVPIYNSDTEAKKLINSSHRIREDITMLLGKEAFLEDRLNRSYVAQRVFKDANLLARLNSIVHPAVRQHFLKWTSEQNFPYVIQETAVLFENNAMDQYDKIILVTAPVNVRIERILGRDNTTKTDILSRMDNQLPDQEKLPLANYVINNIVLEDTALQVMAIHQEILEFSGH